MKSFDNFIGRLRQVDYSEDDMVEAEKVEIDDDELGARIEAIIDIQPEVPTLYRARKESKEMVREMIAKCNALKGIYASAVDHYRSTEVTKDAETLCMLFSDWHLGKVIKKADGTIAYNSEIAFKRVVDDFAPQIIENIKRVGKASEIEDVRLFFVGDIVDNDIVYHTQRLHIDKPVTSQFQDATKAIMVLIGAIRTAFESIGKKDIPIKIDMVPGNHGRAGANQSDDGECNWDTAIAIALDLALSYSDIPNISLDYTTDKYKVVEVRGHKGLLRHAAPPQAETSGAKAKLGGWNELFDYDFMCYGHLHHWGINTYSGKPLFRNGSLCGTDDLAIELATGDCWGQLMWGVSDQDLPTFIHRLR